MTNDQQKKEITQDERNLLELLADLNKMERRCKHMQTSVAVPPSVYSLLGKLRDKVAQWGIEAIVRGGE